MEKWESSYQVKDMLCINNMKIKKLSIYIIIACFLSGCATASVTGANGVKKVNTSKISIFPGMSKQNLKDTLGEPLEVTSKGGGFEEWKYLTDIYPYGNVPIIFRFDKNGILINYSSINIRQPQPPASYASAHLLIEMLAYGALIYTVTQQANTAAVQERHYTVPMSSNAMPILQSSGGFNSRQNSSSATNMLPYSQITPPALVNYKNKTTGLNPMKWQGEYQVYTPGYGATTYEINMLNNRADIIEHGPNFGTRSHDVEFMPSGSGVTMLDRSTGRQYDVTQQPSGDLEVHEYGAFGSRRYLQKQ